MNVGPYAPLPCRAAEKRNSLKYVTVDGAPGCLCIPLLLSPVGCLKTVKDSSKVSGHDRDGS